MTARSRNLPKIFKAGNNFQDCVALIDISRVCRRWREIALTDSSLWSSIYIHLDNPTAASFQKTTYFADTCLWRSLDLPLTIVVTLTNLSELRPAYPLMHAVIAHEVRWSRIAVNLTSHPQSPESNVILISESDDEFTGIRGLSLRTAGSSNLKEFQSNMGPLFTYSMTQPLPALESLKISCCDLLDSIYTLTKWLPLASNLHELEIKVTFDRFISNASEQNQPIWLVAAAQTQVCPHFVLPSLQTLNIWTRLLPYFTCPALEKYVMEMLSWRAQDLTEYLEFVERSGTPPSFRTIEIIKQDDLLDIEYVRGSFLPTITSLYVTSPGRTFFEMFLERFPGGGDFRLLPGLEHLEVTACRSRYRLELSVLVASRWNIGASRRTLRSVKLKECFRLSPMLKLLLSPPRDGIDLTRVEWIWREIARCVNEGLFLSV
ncbi:hypothetical protein SCHPADRAFT_597994 [Schizopora paradoxa]|uniref:F-box domain-containing protein n=1 Tax=Schizopora paradoxa TaxID=27342 RepID=A0A0H2RA09_9AGAM|nr:hypothetical protein SCHPADRAFT_597994 [Schizopora paradoxa]